MIEPTLYRLDRDRWESRDRFDMEALEMMLDEGVLVPVEPSYVGAILGEWLPLITDNQVADVIEALGVRYREATNE